MICLQGENDLERSGKTVAELVLLTRTFQTGEGGGGGSTTRSRGKLRGKAKVEDVDEGALKGGKMKCWEERRQRDQRNRKDGNRTGRVEREQRREKGGQGVMGDEQQPGVDGGGEEQEERRKEVRENANAGSFASPR